MKNVIIVMFLFYVLSAQAQVHKVDSLLDHHAHAYDTAFQKPKQKIDLIQSTFYSQSDSLKRYYKNNISKLDTATSSIRNKIDSLNTLHLPTGKYTDKLDSINTLRKQSIASLNSKITLLKSKTTDKLKTIQVPTELNEKLAAARKEIDGFQLTVKDLNMPSLNLPDNPIKSLDGLNTSMQSPLGEIGKIDGLEGIQKNLGDISSITGDAGKYQQDLQNITKGNPADVQEVPKALENKAGNLAGVTDLQKQTAGALDPLKDMADKAQNPEAMQGEVLQRAQEVAIDHFAGKEEVLQQAMDKMAKYKQKYASVNSLSDIAKRRPNEMHAKPLIERLVPGIGYQIQKKGSDLLVDFNPYVGYRFTGRITAGAGWNQRVPFNYADNYTKHQVAVYGPRFFGEYKLSKGISPRLEIEYLNTNVPVALSKHTHDPSSRYWVWSYIAGIKKDYRIYKSIKGTASIMFNFFDPHHRSPYADRVITRFGFEFPMKKKSAK